MEFISRIGTDTSKHIFQLHGVNVAEQTGSAAALAKALSSGWATTRSARKEGLFRFSRACRHEHKSGFYCGDILRPTSIR